MTTCIMFCVAGFMLLCLYWLTMDTDIAQETMDDGQEVNGRTVYISPSKSQAAIHGDKEKE